MTVAIHLYGDLADKYGPLHHYEIGSAREAISLLDANYPGFLRDFVAGETYGIHADGDWVGGDDMGISPVSRELHICPAVEGGGPFIFTPLLGLIGIYGTAATIIGSLLSAALFIGLSFLFKPKVPKDEDDGRRESFAFTGPDNVTAQGVPVPMVYGFGVHCGSIVVSVGLEVDNLEGINNQWFPAYTGVDNLRSRQRARIVDLISEGQVWGPTYPNFWQCLFFDGTPILNPVSGAYNFPLPGLDFRYGTLGQSYMPGYASQEQEVAVSSRIRASFPLTRTINNPEVDRVRLTLSTPSLYRAFENNPKIYEAQALFNVSITGLSTTTIEFNGKVQGRYQASYVFPLPQAYKDAGWTITITRPQPDSPDSSKRQDETWWDSYTEITDDRISYNLSCVAALNIDAEQFQTIPKRVYLMDGILVALPTNYNSRAGTYSGIWNGGFGLLDATNNPVWILLDLITHRRRGLGDFISFDMVDKGTMYRVAQYCDEQVPNGKGGYEKRHTCNVQIMDQFEAFDLLAQVASIFRGFYYWSAGTLITGADMPGIPVQQFTNANVIDGQFNYSGADVRAQHNQALVRWRDPDLLGDVRVAIVEGEPDSISRLGLQPIEFALLGCTSESQAIRAGKWALYVEQYESEVVAFTAGLEAAYLQPGNIIRIMDANISGPRRGGRVAAGTTAAVINCDGELDGITASGNYQLHCQMFDGTIQTRQVSFIDVSGIIYVAVPFPAAPAPDTVWVLVSIGALEATEWFVAEVKANQEEQTYSVNAKRHLGDKYAYIERNIALTPRDTTDIKFTPDPPRNLRVDEYLVKLSPSSVGVEATVTWESPETSFELNYRLTGDNWHKIVTNDKAVNVSLSEGTWEFSVQSISIIGRKSLPAKLIKTIIGKLGLPAQPQRFRISVVQGVAFFEWVASVELDVLIGGHYELRHSAGTVDTSWAGAQVVVASIPGNASSVQVPYQTGTWFLKALDSGNRESKFAAIIIAFDADSAFKNYFEIHEEPTYLGSKDNTEILLPQEWLILGSTGLLVDSNTDLIDTWTDVDNGTVLADEEDPDIGTYQFTNEIDMGGLFAVRFISDILAFPYQKGGDFIDARLGLIDDWTDIDSGDAGDLHGNVTIEVRHTPDDPGGTPTWSDWEVLTSGEYVDRGFQFRAVLYAPPGENVGVERLSILADVRNKFDAAEDVAYAAATLRVNYTVKFYTIPAVAVTAQNLATGDVVTIVAKTREYFDIEIKNSIGTHVTRTFDWIAQGY